MIYLGNILTRTENARGRGRFRVSGVLGSTPAALTNSNELSDEEILKSKTYVMEQRIDGLAMLVYTAEVDLNNRPD